MVDLNLLQENEDLKFRIKELENMGNGPKRQTDLDHLSKIPVIETHINYIREKLDSIETGIKDVPAIKTDVSWLKSWHNKIVLGIILAGALGILSLIFTIVKKGL